MAFAPFQRVATFPLEGSIEETADSPSTCSVKRIEPAGRQRRALGEDLRSGVMSFASPPEAGTVQMSPPVEPSSLIRPWMTAIVFPSGENRGQAICSGGFQTDRACPVSARTT